MLDNTNYSQAVDMWSVGTIINELLTGQIMFDRSTEIEQIISIFKVRGSPS